MALKDTFSTISKGVGMLKNLGKAMKYIDATLRSIEFAVKEFTAISEAEKTVAIAQVETAVDGPNENTD